MLPERTGLAIVFSPMLGHTKPCFCAEHTHIPTLRQDCGSHLFKRGFL